MRTSAGEAGRGTPSRTPQVGGLFDCLIICLIDSLFCFFFLFMDE